MITENEIGIAGANIVVLFVVLFVVFIIGYLIALEFPSIMPKWWCEKMDLHQSPPDSEILIDINYNYNPTGHCPKCGVKVYQEFIHEHWHKVN